VIERDDFITYFEQRADRKLQGSRREWKPLRKVSASFWRECYCPGPKPSNLPKEDPVEEAAWAEVFEDQDQKNRTLSRAEREEFPAYGISRNGKRFVRTRAE